MRRMLIASVLVLFAIALGAGELAALNPRQSGSAAGKLHPYSFLAKKTDQGIDTDRFGRTDRVALGAYTSDGGSPGYIIGRSWRDDQNHGGVGRFVDWRTNPQLHFVYAAQACGGHTNPQSCARWIHYNMYDPTTAPNGVFISGANGIPIQVSPFNEGGMYPNMEVDENGRMIAVGEGITAAEGEDFVRWVKVWWDVSPATVFGTFEADSIPDQIVGTGAVNYHYPVMAYQEFGGMYITHVLALNGTGTSHDDAMIVTHWRKESTSTGLGGTWTTNEIVDGPWTDAYDIAVSRDGGGKAAIIWLRARSDTEDIGSSINLITSDNAGLDWTAPVDIVPFEEGTPSWQPWLEASVLYDSENKVHVAYNAQEYDGSSATSIDPARVIHWSERTDATSLVDHLDFHGLSDVDCAGSSNILNNGKVSISECAGRLYTIWCMYGNLDVPEDCAADSVSDGFRGSANADIFMNISLGLDGLLWDFRRNLTNSATPECDGSDAFPCDHDAFPAISRYGMDTKAMGTTYWNAVPEALTVRDDLDPNWGNDSLFLDIQFVNDIVADIARYMDDPVWSNNPIKWFRLPCVPPVIEPRILFDSDPYVHPSSWVPSSTLVNLDLPVTNIGNDDLEIISVTSTEIQGAGWLTVNTGGFFLEPSADGVISITLNSSLQTPPPGGAIAIEGWVIVNSNDVHNSPDSFYINTVIADDVIQVAHEVIRTGYTGTGTGAPGEGVPMGPVNIGTAGDYPETGGYMQFYEEDGIDLDCDSFDVWLYDMTPVVMTDAATGWWAPYYNDADPDSNNFVPIPGVQKTESCSDDVMEQFLTGDFVITDSTIGMNKAWAAPSDDVSFVIERWQIFSRNGAIHTDVQLGEYLDVDVPSDTGAENYGAVIGADDYFWMSGLEDADGTTCEASDQRFYAAGLLGWYYTSEYALDDEVNNTGLAGCMVNIHPTLMDDDYNFVPDSLWEYMSNPIFQADNSSWDDQRAFLAYGGFDIKPADTLVIWTVHGSLIRATETDVADQIAAAKVWYMANRSDIGVCGCCGLYTGGIPGNVDFLPDGKMNLADITRLIDRVYVSKIELLCEENGNVDSSTDGKINLADITKLIDVVYVSKIPPDACL